MILFSIIINICTYIVHFVFNLGENQFQNYSMRMHFAVHTIIIISIFTFVPRDLAPVGSLLKNKIKLNRRYAM